MHYFGRLVLVLSVASAGVSFAQVSSPSASESAQPTDQAGTKLSTAEQITNLERSIEKDKQLLWELREKLDKILEKEGEASEAVTSKPAAGEKPAATQKAESEYTKAKTEFRQLDEELTASRKRLEKLEEEGKQTEAADLKSSIKDLEKRWKLAKERFDLAIQERKALQEQIASLEEKIKRDRELLQKMQSPATQPADQPVEPTATAPAPPAAESGTAAPAAAPPTTGLPEGRPPAAEPSPPAAETEEKAPSKEVLEAQKEVELKEKEAKKAEQEVQSLSDQIDQLNKSLANQQQLLDIATNRMVNARETEQAVIKQLQDMSAGGADPEKLRELSSQITDARDRRWETQQEIDRSKDEIQRLQAEKARLQSERITALQQAETAREETTQAQKELEQLRNPFAPRNLLRWVIKKGPKAGGILVAMILLLWIIRSLTHRIVKALFRRLDRVSKVEREKRAQTLASVFQNAASIAIVVWGLLTILQVLDVPIAPVLGGAAVFGLAIAFGAQNLIRDYFYGFMILLENQYGVNDVVKICDISGLVERVTLRVTVLRDLEGVAHFIPNGQITTVSNMTHVWSRALFDIGVAYKEDVDQVMRVLMEIGQQMRHDPEYGHLILEDPEMLGVDQFGDSAVVIKFFIKTRPLQQWTVKREMLRRIKKRFDELGIEIPFPHRTIYHHKVEEAPLSGPDGPG